MEQALQVQNLSKTYGNFRLKNITFSLPKGYMMGLIGPNGSGKTTIIKAILNMISIDNGKITIFHFDNKDNEQLIKEKIGVVFDSSYFVSDWKMDDVSKSFSLFYDNWKCRDFYQWLHKFGIDKTKKVSQLSKGMQMKLMLACAFSHNSELLILDEPTSGLDPVSREELLNILEFYTADKNHSVLFSTHITSDLEKVADYITFINMGNEIYVGTKEKFIEKYRLVKGDCKDLENYNIEKLIGVKKNIMTFEALILADSSNYYSKFKICPATINDILVFTTRQIKNDYIEVSHEK